jgi:ATP-binding cassette subfamily B protein/ATP-binding cassette subfamily C protein
MVRYRPVLFFGSMVMWTIIHGSPILFGIVVGWIFDVLTNEAPAATSAWTLVLVFGVLSLLRNGVLWTGDQMWIRYWNDQGLQLRRNLLRWLLEAEGSRILVSSPGEAVSTFRDDVDDLLEYVENWVDLGGLVVFGVGSVIVMMTIDTSLTLILLVPLLATVVVTRALSSQIRARRRAMRLATEDVTGLIGETFGAVQSIKLAAAEDPMLSEFHRRNEIRREAALRDTFLAEILRSINVNMATVAGALVLLVSAAAVRDGSFTIGELAVFLTYLPRLTGYLGFFGNIIAQHRRTGVAYERIRTLAVDADDAVLLDRTRVPLDGEVGELPPRDRRPADRLHLLEVDGLSFVYPGSTDGIHDVSFDLERGSFTVITGKIGAGKTTVLRGLLGLIPAEGQVRWNGREVHDLASFLVPPRSAYTPQVPSLFSDTLAYNIALQEHTERADIHAAAHLAVLDPDLDRLAAGIDTLVGARGVKLSGGQIQRSAAARMFATDADLLVFDDLSSALDLHTEAELWDRLFSHRQATCLVVSHRPAALERADEILVMDGGRVVDRGTLEDLLGRSELMRELWEAESGSAPGPAGR